MKIRKTGVTGTFIFHIILLIIFLILGFSTPLPLPSEEGILINFGVSEYGEGKTESEKNINEQPINKPEEEVPSEPANEATEKSIITQEIEDAPFVENKVKAPEKTDNKKNEIQKPVTPAVPKKVEEKPKTVNKQALYKARDNNAIDNNGEGINGQTDNNQGVENGSNESKNYFQGTSGKGFEYSLEGRTGYLLPEPEYSYQEEGKVVVEITVNRDGIVTNAIPGIKGSTTLEKYFLDAAKKAALNSRFDRKPDAPAFQKGTITYYFKLKD